MEYRVKEEYRNEKLYSKVYEINQILNVDIIIDILQKCESETTTMYKCYCYTLTERGTMWNPEFYSKEEYHSINELQEMKKLPVPNILVTAIYINNLTNEYKFAISVATNTNIIVYQEEEEMKDVVCKRMEVELQIAKEREEPLIKKIQL